MEKKRDSNMSLLKPPETESAIGSSRHSSAVSSVQSGSVQFYTAVRMLAPVIWSRLEARKKKSDTETSVATHSLTNLTTNSNHGKVLEPLRLEEELDIHHLETLMFKFMTHIPDKVALKKWLARRGSVRDNLRFRSSGLMTLDEFHEMLSDLLNVEIWDEEKLAVFEKEIETLFKKVDIASDGLVDWDEFCTYLMHQFQENDQAMKHNSNTFIPKPNIVRIDHNKETTTKILTDFNPMRYVTLSKEGIIGVWSTELEFQRKIEMENNNLKSERTSSKRHIKMWVTDAVTMPNVHKMALASTNRDIYFYDMSTPIYTPLFHICALGNVALCLYYHYNKKSPAGKSILFLGMDNGVVLFLTFSTPVKGLFETPFKKTSGSHQVYFQDLSAHSRFVTYQSLGQVHSDWVRRVKYIPLKDFVISCSGSGKDSLVVRDIDDKKRKTYTFKVAKGVECFDYSFNLNVICTGGVDHAVRLWNPYVTAKPVAIMKGHQASIIDLVIHETLEQVFSYDKDGVLKAWEIKEQVCLQTISIRFPFGHRTPEHGPFPFLLLPSPINSLLISSNDCLAEIKIVGMGTGKSTKTTHWRPICAALYNHSMGQVITACEGSVITYWDLNTGRQAQQVTEGHGTEISCMTIDSTGRRLMTGDRSGCIHVWNASNGHLLNKMEPTEEAEVTGIIPLSEKSKIVTVGWNRKIVVYYDDEQTFCLRPNASWKGGQLHQDDILTATFCPPNYLATGSFDGDIILWSLDREKMMRRLKKGSGSLLKAKIMKLGLFQRRRSLQNGGSSSGSPVDKLLFLTSRAQWKSQESAVLVSAEAGALEFWCLYGSTNPLGKFYAASQEESFILAVTTDPNNELLITGDSNGVITVWDISSYCISRAECIIAQVWSTTQRAYRDCNPEGRPSQVSCWHAHQGTVSSVEYLARDQGALIVSASEDCTARLWTVDGQYIGMFGQKRLWNIDDPCTYRLAGSTWDEGKETEKANMKRTKSANQTSSVERTSADPPSPPPASPTHTSTSPQTTEMPWLNRSTSTTPREHGLLPTIEVAKVGEDGGEEDPFSWRKSDYYRSMTSLVLERSAKNSWSILGDHYNKDFRRRMKTRQSRRNHVGHVDKKLTSGGGLGITCSPFQALHIPDTKEYELPSNMPVTPRMVHKASHASGEPLWMTVRQGSLPPLPTLKRSDSFLTMTSVNRVESASGNASQFSFLVE